MLGTWGVFIEKLTWHQCYCASSRPHETPFKLFPSQHRRDQVTKKCIKRGVWKFRTLAELETCCSLMSTTCTLSAFLAMYYLNISCEQFNLRLHRVPMWVVIGELGLTCGCAFTITLSNQKHRQDWMSKFSSL